MRPLMVYGRKRGMARSSRKPANAQASVRRGRVTGSLWSRKSQNAAPVQRMSG